MSDFDDLLRDLDDGMEGRNAGVPTGFTRLNGYMTIRKSMIYLIGGYTGCLTGDTIVEVARKRMTANTKPYTMEQFYNKFHGKARKDKWKMGLPTRVKVYMPDKLQTSVHEIEDVLYSGRKEVYKVTTDSGKIIRATQDHKFMITEAGEFKRLGMLRVGDDVICKAPKESRKRGRTLKNRVEICGKYPYYHTARKKIISGKEYQRIYLYRAIFDAHKNGMQLEEFMVHMRSSPDHRLILSDPKMVVHHVDGNPLNNDPSNLALISKQVHDRMHARTSNYGYSWVRKEKIISIQHLGERDTYDIVCKDPYHNFIANGFVVHNSGKTALLDDAFVLNPVEWYLNDGGRSGIDLEIIYWSMERRKNFKLMKWVSRRIFLDHGIIIPVSRMMGWCPRNERLTLEERNLFSTYRDYVGALSEIVKIQSYPENPTGIRNYVRERALANGEVEVVDEHTRIYHPHKPNKIILNIYDHIGLIRKEKSLGTKKEIIDKASEDARYFRDFYGISSVKVSQFNRDISSPLRLKSGDVEPMLEDFKETGTTQEDADVVLSLFDPMRYKVQDPSGYDLTKLRDSQGRKKYRSLKVQKNSYGGDDIRIGLAFQPEIGMFREMKKLTDTTDDTYSSIIDNSYFLREQ